ncbi:general secretion pathway gspg related transmembrane protein [Cupriavidus basilensis OR16]|uniref:General secretion pathway gspg related transmembrane protein n=1 Tax=Cupriavidus basilensis OR16 TaxID=1127483 RepID=H1S034_9BURK|nr:type II secretion system protein [Cupriavidus basilensis]EHP44250.1 general secretion pathway gspg related transmembrane protein [Cupriavidus basilensis OR16]
MSIAIRCPARGFTLIELLVTLAVTALLATMVVPLAQVTLQRQHEQELRRALREIRTAIDAYKQATDQGRIQRAIDSTGYPKSLNTLVDGVEDTRDPKKAKIYFLRRIPRDPLYTDYRVPDADTWGKRSYASEPSDPQEGADVYDVFSTSTAIGLNGIPYRRW